MATQQKPALAGDEGGQGNHDKQPGDYRAAAQQSQPETGNESGGREEHRVYDLFADFKPAARGASSGTAEVPDIEISGNLAKVDLDRDLPANMKDRDFIAMLCVQGGDPDDPQRWDSRSECVWYVLHALIRAGCSDDLVAGIILDPDFGISAHVLAQKNARQYAAKQIAKARAEAKAAANTPYKVIDGALHRVKLKKSGDGWIKENVPLCNFDPRIEEQRKVDDGGELPPKIQFQIAGKLADGTSLPTVTVPVEAVRQGKWWLDKWGAPAIVMPEAETHLLPAMQTVSAPVPERLVYAHLGWRKLDGKWVYLHGKGAIGAGGVVDGHEVKLDGKLKHYELPAPTGDLKAAVAASLKLLDLGPVGVALAAATYRAPLGQFCPITFSVFLVGRTGTFKSAAAGIAQAHWNPMWAEGKQLPGAWSSTANALEKATFGAKDALFVIDDFKPKGSASEVEKMHSTADRVLHAVGNRDGRMRMASDISLRETYYPRCMPVNTGEDLPKGESLQARMFVLDVKEGDIDPAKLTVLQSHGRDGLLAQAMAGYLKHLAAQADELPERLFASSKMLAGKITGAGHARTKDNIAGLLLGLGYLLIFAKDVGAITETEMQHLDKVHSETLTDAAVGQDHNQARENEVQRFRRFIGAALNAGRAHLCDRNYGPPKGREAQCGWRHSQSGFKDAWQSGGDRIGFIEDDNLWLIPETAFACAEKLGNEQRNSLGITEGTLGKRLDEAGWIMSKEEDRHTKQVQTKITDGEGQVKAKKIRLYHLSVAQFLPGLMPPVAKPVMPEPPKHHSEGPSDHGAVGAGLSQEEFEREHPPMDDATCWDTEFRRMVEET